MYPPASVDLAGSLALATAPSAAPGMPGLPPRVGKSRRRRLWELGSHAHCPVIGVGLPIAALRRLVDKTVPGHSIVDDYDLHRGAVAECRQRTALSQALHKELERRYGLAVRSAAVHKTGASLAAWWREAAGSTDVAGALWAVLTHAQCTPELEDRVLGDIHMLQHQVGMATRTDAARFEALIDENAVLARALGAAQQRSSSEAARHARQVEQLQSAIVRLRAELGARDALLAQLRAQLDALERGAPDLRGRLELAQENQRLSDQVRVLQRALSRWQRDVGREREQRDEPPPLPGETSPTPAHEAAGPAGVAALVGRAVLCVGGRSSSVPAYRQLVERIGARFLHHDGGDEESTARLDARLAAADLVICQSGCISHHAYWRVKDHCKRTGKRCLFVENPGRASLERVLGVSDIAVEARAREAEARP